MPASATDYFQKVGLSTATTLSSPGYTIGNTSINVASTTNWPTDTGISFAIDEIDGNGERIAGTYNVFRGTVSGATQISNLVYVGGDANRNYSAGATTRVYITVSSYRDNRMVDGLAVEHKQTGAHSDVTADSITVTDLTVTGDLTVGGVGDNGWVSTGGTHSVATGYNSGNRSFEIDTTTDLTGIVSPGMRYRVTRNTTPPTQCADLESSSSQYASKSSPTGLTQTDDITFEAWFKPESYGTQYLACKTTTPGTNGWRVYLTDGQIFFNGNGRYANTYQSLSLGKWQHIAVTIDMSASTVLFYIDGVLVPSTALSSTGATWTNSGNFFLGSNPTPGSYIDGKLADVRVWSDIRTATEIQDNMYAYPSDTTGLVAHFKLNGDFTDASSNANNLTASGGAVATDADNPWNATEQGIITNVTASTIQVFCPSGYGIPNETLTAPFYSTQSAPFGFPRDKGLWEIMHLSFNSSAAITNATWVNAASISLSVPTGAWNLKASVYADATRNTATAIAVGSGLSESSSTVSAGYWESQDIMTVGGASGTQRVAFNMKPEIAKSYTAQTTIYHVIYATITAGTLASATATGIANGHRLIAECAYL